MMAATNENHTTTTDEGMSISSTRSNASLLSMSSSSSLTKPTMLIPDKEQQEDALQEQAKAEINNEKASDDGRIELEFSDFTDLQTRLVLLPRVEEEGIGAILQSYISQKSPQSSPDEHGDEELRDDQESTTDKWTGSVLIGISDKDEDWKDMEFSAILASIRESSQPFKLVFLAAKPLDSPPNSPPKSPVPEVVEATLPPAEVDSSIQTGMMTLSKWGMRMRAQATDAANSAAAMASAAKEKAGLLQQQQQQQPSQQTSGTPCNVFLQTSVGAFIPVAAAQSKVTTSSLLLVRKSATESVGSEYSFQWYRSSSPSLVDDGASLSSKSQEGTVDAMNNEEVEWVELEGATSAAFQPNTTLVGRRLRCMVLQNNSQPNDHSSDDSSLEEDLDESIDNNASKIIMVYDLQEPVSADLTLFNGARQALMRGAKFGGFVGKGNASNRKFLVEISIGRKRKKTCSAIQIYQMSGQESQPLESAFLQATAVAHPANPKQLDFILPNVSENSIFRALCTDGVFQLEAPNRLTRESILLAVGIANYTGKPANLSARTVLYKDESPRALFDDESSVAASSCASSVQSSPSVVPDARSIHSAEDDSACVADLEKQVEFLRNKLGRKDKVISELQRQVTHSEKVFQQTKQQLATTQQDLKNSRVECQDFNKKFKSANSKISAQNANLQKIKDDHGLHTSSLENRIMSQSEKIADVEKSARSLQNEKAVLSAAVEARESKLVKMGELQTSFEELSEKVADHNKLRNELEESNKRHQSIQQDLDQVAQVERECRAELLQAQEKVETLATQIQKDKEKHSSIDSQLDILQKKNQQLKGERNNYKQKNDSLSKEISRLCRNGRSIKDIEKAIADYEALREEVELLRVQKRKALEEAHQYRTSYEQSKVAQKLSGMDHETHVTLERNAELERLLAEMTEYVNAKEMQLETLKQVNGHLQSEIHSLAQANLSKNEV